MCFHVSCWHCVSQQQGPTFKSMKGARNTLGHKQDYVEQIEGKWLLSAVAKEDWYEILTHCINNQFWKFLLHFSPQTSESGTICIFNGFFVVFCCLLWSSMLYQRFWDDEVRFIWLWSASNKASGVFVVELIWSIYCQTWNRKKIVISYKIEDCFSLSHPTASTHISLFLPLFFQHFSFNCCLLPLVVFVM